jgi:hypothetical protein
MNTPETDAEHAQFAMGGFTLDFCRKLERERDEARNERDVLRLDSQREAEHHDRMVAELEGLYDKNAKLLDITERALQALYEADLNKFPYFRAELEQLKEGVK